MTTRADLQRAYDEYKRDGRYGHLLALVERVRDFLAGDDPSVEVAYLKATLADVEAENERLERWKAEALPVMSGLQELGEALGVRPGERITGHSSAEAARALRARAEAAEQANQRVRGCAQQALEFADRTMDDSAAHWARVAAADILRALDGGA